MNEPLITIVGNLTSDPELKVASSGVSAARFTVAATPRRKEGDKWVDGTTIFWWCIAFKDLADNLTDSLTKGSRVIVTGRIERTTWTDKEGNDKEALQLLVDEIGPSLRFHAAKVTKVDNRTKAVSGAATSSYDDDPPPF